MSEYQYYEFRALDRPLTPEQVDELRACSSRARISPDRFVNVYNWGDFKGDPDKWMEKYFDAFLYLANWGTRILKLRVPKHLLDSDIVREYCTGESLSCRTSGGHLIFSFHSEEEDSDWEDGEGWLSSLVQLRSDLMRGDYRCLYLGWLVGAHAGEIDDDTLEPPVPPGLGSPNASLQSFSDFLRIDPDFITAAAEKSEKRHAGDLSREDISRWVANLSPEDKDSLLMRLLGGDDLYLAADLRRRALREIRGEGKSGSDSQTSDLRSVSELAARAEAIAEQRRKRQAEEEERQRTQRERAQAEQRKKHLESLRGKENVLWGKVDKLIATKQPKRYDEAVLLLKDLRDLGDMKGASSDFEQRMSSLYRGHAKKPSLVDRFRKAKLPG
jgi:FtsZ-interacting cell division protein YlmF